MARQDQSTRIPLTRVTDVLEQSIVDHDQQRAEGLGSLGTLRRAKAAQLAREQARLSRKLGSDAPRVQEVAAKLAANQSFMVALKYEADRARIEVPAVAADSWVFHGHVLDDKLAGVPDLTVALYDANGT